MGINLSTNAFYDRSAKTMSSLTARAEALQVQIASEKKLQTPSDDSAGYKRLQGIRVATANDKVFATNVTVAQSVAAQADTALTSMTNLLQQASEWAVQANGGTLSAEGKKILASQLRGTIGGLVDLANADDSRGQPLMGGATGGQAVTLAANGTLVFAEGRPSAIPIGDGQTIDPSVDAATFLKLPGGRDVAQVLAQMADALEAGNAPPAALQDELTAIGVQTTQAQASLGARVVRLDLQAGYLQDNAIDREATRSDIEDLDITQAITQLQKTMTILSATQASFSKLQGLSLFNFLR